jgi:L-asparaginase
MFGSSIIFSHTGLMRKDSLDMNDYDREMVVLACRSSNKDKILITHGTDTMIDTARSIHSAGLGKNKTIVLTGALQPAVMRDTDAMFHLGLAAGACLGLPYGVWIAVNGVHPWNECRKDEVNGMFVPIQ